MADWREYLKGAGRVLGPDNLGYPMDTATDAINLGIGAGGYLGHKLGLIPTSKLPDLIEKKSVPGTSEWLSSGTPFEDKGNPDYQKAVNTASLLLLARGVKPNNLKLASPATLQTPTGEVFVPIYAPQNVKAIEHLKNRPGDEIPLTDVYPDLKHLLGFNNESIVSDNTLSDNLHGFYQSPLQKLTINSNKDIFDLRNTVAHESTHALDPVTNSLSTGGNVDNFAGGGYSLTAGFGKQYFPGENLRAFAAWGRQNPGAAYKGLVGEGRARIGGKLQELMARGGSQVPTQQLIDAVMRLETNNWANAGITPRLINPATGDADQVYLPAHLGKQMINQGGKLFDQAGNLIGYAKDY